MTVFYADKNVRIEFRVVRAFPTSQLVQNEYGIFSNFSAKTVLITKQGKSEVEIELMSHNSLMIATSRENETFVSSKSERPIIERNGKTVELEPVYFFSLFPGAHWGSDQELKERHRTFVRELVEEIAGFIREKQELRAERESAPREVPAMLQGLRALSPAVSLKKPAPTTNDSSTPI